MKRYLIQLRSVRKDLNNSSWRDGVCRYVVLAKDLKDLLEELDRYFPSAEVEILASEKVVIAKEGTDTKEATE